MTGINNIDKWAKALGLGEKTGVELPGEIEGIRSNRNIKRRFLLIYGEKLIQLPLQLGSYTMNLPLCN